MGFTTIEEKDPQPEPETAIVEYHESDVLNTNVSMADKMEIATNMATTLKDVLEKQGLTLSLNKKNPEQKYVTSEGWNTLGTMLGTYARTEEVVPVEFTKARIAYRARVSIVQGEQVLATAEAIATSGGHQKEEHQIYSMAQTRAMGKAYRMAFSWIIKLAGYEPTPAEEMLEQKKEEKKQKAKNRNGFTDEQKKKLKSAVEVKPKDIEVVE